MMKCIDKIRGLLDSSSAAVITSEASRRYLSGFAATDGYVIITPNSAVFFADSRYIEDARANIKELGVELFSGFKSVREFLGKEKIDKTFIETEYLTLGGFATLKKALEVKVSRSNALSETIRKCRMVKTESEISNILAAQKITDAAFKHILNYVKAGVSERDIALELDFFMRRMGSEGVSFDTIAVGGKNSSLPHGVPSDYKLQNGDMLTMDFGAVVNGYHSDMTRTVAIGEIGEKQRLVYNTVLKAQSRAIAEIKEGIKCSVIDKIARDCINEAGFGAFFGHALGHSVGLEIHETPNFSPRCDEVLKENMVLTVEPGIYLGNEFGVRIENMIIVKANTAVNITESPRELIIV